MRLVWLSLAVVSACSFDDTVWTDLSPSAVTRVEYKDLPVWTPRRIDLLFVIDSSPAMAPFRANVLANFHLFADVLSTIQGGLPRIHVAVVTGDLGTLGGRERGPCRGFGDDGRFHRASAVDGAFLSDDGAPNGTPVHNYTGAIEDAFVQLADVGTSGCPYQQPLAAAARALGDPRNAGFRRANAQLFVMFVTPQDDCSFTGPGFLDRDPDLAPLDTFRCTRHAGELRSTDAFAALLKLFVDDPTDVIVAGLFGPPAPLVLGPGPVVQPSCTFDGASAQPGVRLSGLLDAFPNRSAFASICQQDLSAGLTLVGGNFDPVIGSPCLDGVLRDADPTMPGVQPDCTVSDVQYPGRADETAQLLPSCDTTTSRPCWLLAVDAQSCPTGSQLALSVERDGDAPDGDHVIAQCEVE